MKKRLLSLLLAVMMVVSVITISVGSVSAAETNQNASSADGNFYFSVPDFWQTEYGITPGDKKTTVFCYIFTIGGSDPDFPNISWQSKGTKCTWNAALGLYEFPAATKYNLKDDADYCVIFSARNTVSMKNPQCYDLTMGTDCLGDTVYLTTQTYENPQDSKKIANAAYWTDEANAAKYGPHAGITSLGVLQGEKYAPHEDKELAIASFIHDFSANAKPETCPTLCEKIGVEAYDVYVKYSTTYAADIEAGVCPALDITAGLLGLDYPPVPPTSEEPTTEEPTTEEPTTAEPTTEEPTTAEPTTEEPTTAEPTTEEPTTAEPATEEPTTEEPTTEEPTTEPVPVKKYTVAGDAALTGVMWDPASNEMTEGTYEFDGNTYDFAITFEDVPAGAYGFKVTNGTWDEAYPTGNFTFSTGDTGYVKVYFNSETKEIAVDPEFPKTWELESIIAVGNGDGTWLNGANWDLTDTSNLLTEVETGIWEITYEDIDAYDGYEVKFACNQAWQPYNWTIDGVLDGQTNTPIAVPFDNATVTLRIDVNSFDFATGEGSVQTAVIIKNSKGHVLGDVDGDGEATIKDASAIQMYLAKLAEDGDTFDAQVADFNADGKVNIFDVAA
ncbi:MAG: dockerin type I domain-containing protein, partial [Ruminococcus sp.]|nr:dockerin type I domain-containing protein [Ruminococcus sp.]